MFATVVKATWLFFSAEFEIQTHEGGGGNPEKKVIVFFINKDN